MRSDPTLSALPHAPLDRIRPFSVMATVVAGLESIAAAQIAAQFPQATIRTVRAKVFFDVKTTLSQLLTLRCAENLHAVLATLPCGRTNADLPLFGAALKKPRTD